jgi:hypothetical protein
VVNDVVTADKAGVFYKVDELTDIVLMKRSTIPAQSTNVHDLTVVRRGFYIKKGYCIHKSLQRRAAAFFYYKG